MCRGVYSNQGFQETGHSAGCPGQLGTGRPIVLCPGTRAGAKIRDKLLCPATSLHKMTFQKTKKPNSNAVRTVSHEKSSHRDKKYSYRKYLNQFCLGLRLWIEHTWKKMRFEDCNYQSLKILQFPMACINHETLYIIGTFLAS